MINCTHLANFLTTRFGLLVTVGQKPSEKGQLLIIRPDGVEHTIGFSIEVVVGWRSIEGKFLFGDYSSTLVRSMMKATRDQKRIFRAFSESIKEHGGSIRLVIGGEAIDSTLAESWPKVWEPFELSFRRGSLLIDHASESDLACVWIARFLGAVISLLPFEDISSSQELGEKEGEASEVLLTRYERSKINRAACMEIHGIRCKVCDIHFGETYGEIGEGFIHVHHVFPVSLMSEQYALNPREDLVPVCPNCHAMLHRQTPPLDISQLKNNA